MPEPEVLTLTRTSRELSDAPDSDTFEVSIFGPGVGECVLVHLLDNRWMIIDSCVDRPRARQPALSYLERAGVDASSAVQLVVATHAHLDHVEGLARVFEACEAASFVTSAAMTSEDFFRCVELDEQVRAGLRGSVFKELSDITRLIQTRGLQDGLSRGVHAYPGRELFAIPGRSRVIALSPSDQSIERSRNLLASYFGNPGTRRRVPRGDVNDFAIAIWVEVDGRAALLGADVLAGPKGCGWRGILSSFSPSGPRAELVKIPHHGAPNAHHDGMWDKLASDRPIGILTPFRTGAPKRPTGDDISRLQERTSALYSAAEPEIPPPSALTKHVARALRGTAANVRQPDGRPGHVRARVDKKGPGWNVDLVAPALSLTE